MEYSLGTKKNKQPGKTGLTIQIYDQHNKKGSKSLTMHYDTENKQNAINHAFNLIKSFLIAYQYASKNTVIEVIKKENGE